MAIDKYINNKYYNIYIVNMSLEKNKEKILNQEITNESYKYVNPIASQPLIIITKSPESLYKPHLYGLGLTGGAGTITIPTNNLQTSKKK